MVFTHELTKKLGAEFVFGITGDYLEKDETGRVTALIGHNYKKEYFRFIGTNGIILAAGDFSGNKAMVMDLLGEYAALTENGEKFPYIPAGRKARRPDGPLGRRQNGTRTPGRHVVLCGRQRRPHGRQCLPAPQQARQALHQ